MEKEPLKCDGDCEEHNGEIVEVKVYSPLQAIPWYFNYCQAAIELDEREGFVVIKINK